MRIAVIGGGSWGTALAHLLAGKGFAVSLLVRSPDLAEEISVRHSNERYLPGLALHPSLAADTDSEQALAGAEICLLATPCRFLRETLRTVARHVPRNAVPVCASKGIEADTGSRMSEVVAAELPVQAARYAVLSGPSFAAELVAGKPTAVVMGCFPGAPAESLREIFSTALFRVYSSSDVIGVEIGGAVKNVIAVAAGICDGLGLGHNARAGLITRGLAEISRLGAAMGARPGTFMGLSGLGDLALTCTGDLSRNRQVGMRLAAGERLTGILAGMHMVAEGVTTTRAVRALARKLRVDMPIADSMYRILYANVLPGEAVQELMTRALKEEEA